MEKEQCIFCKIRKGEIPTNLLYVDSKCFVILDAFPSQRGHMLVISRDHHQNFLETPDPLSAHMFKVAKKFARKAKLKLGATGVKLVVNIGKDAGQLVEHTHIHVLPSDHLIRQYSVGPNPKLSEKEAEKLVKLLSEISNAHAFEPHNLDT